MSRCINKPGELCLYVDGKVFVNLDNVCVKTPDGACPNDNDHSVRHVGYDLDNARTTVCLETVDLGFISTITVDSVWVLSFIDSSKIPVKLGLRASNDGPGRIILESTSRNMSMLIKVCGFYATIVLEYNFIDFPYRWGGAYWCDDLRPVWKKDIEDFSSDSSDTETTEG
jgi:hypothetical protein